MTYRILFCGDVVGKSGRSALQAGLPGLIHDYRPLFTIVNGENAAGGVGLTPDIAEEFYKLGVDAITLGNHAFNKREIIPYLGTNKPIVRPINMPKSTPGKGVVTVVKDGVSLAVANLCGRVYMDGYDDPFEAAEDIVELAGDAHLFVDFHGEATSEKVAMAFHLDGRACAVVGTHTHVQTADERILEGGTAAITDVGMTGPVDSVIGMDKEIILRKFRTSLPQKFEVSTNPGRISGIIVDIDRQTGLATHIERIQFST